MSDRALRDLIDAVDKGEPIDWRSAERRIDNRAMIDAAQVLARLAAATRRPLRPRSDGPGPVMRVALALAIVQIAAGSIGMAISHLSVPSGMMLARLGIVASFSSVSVWLFAGRTDARATWLAAYYLLVAAAFAQPGFAVVAAAGAGTWADGYLARGFCVEALLPFALWRFARLFPKILRFSRWDRLAHAGTIAAAFLAAMLSIANLLLAAGRGTGVVSAFDRLDSAGSWFWPAILIFTLAALALIVVRASLAPPDERRRVTLFLAALLTGALPLIGEVLVETFVPAFRDAVSRQPMLRIVGSAIYLSLLTIPFGTAWAVVSARAFDVRVVVRHAARYLFAKRVLQAATAAPFALLVASAVVHRRESLADLVSGPAAASLLLMSAAGLLILGVRRPLQAFIDRAFRRADEDVHRVFAMHAERLRHVRTVGELADVVATATDTALCADAAILVAGADAWFEGVRGTAAPLARSSALAALLQDGDPVVVEPDAPGSVFALLPHADRDWVIATSASVLIPIRSSDLANTTRAVLTCGARRDALRLAGQDTRFLQALAAGAAIALDAVTARNVDDSGDSRFHELANECERCGDICTAGVACGRCGGPLRRAALPQTIHEKYALQARIGRGGMGIVYRAQDLHLGRLVAVKTLPDVGSDERQRLLSEARAMATVVHRHVATIHAVEIWRTTPILVVELLEGGTLAQRLAERRLSLAEVVDLGTCLAQALHYVHAKGFLHLDIKPANVGFAADGTVKLLDFGLAAIQRTSEAPGPAWPEAAGGTLAYMSPEARAGHPASAAYDLWALCVLLYVASTGEYPPAARIASQARPDRRAGAGFAATPLSGFFATAFDPAPERRWPTADAVRRELERVTLTVSA